MSITIKELKNIEILSGIELSDKEREKFTNEIGNIIDWFEELDKIDTTKIDLLSEARLEQMHERVDKVTSGDMVDKILKNAPSAQYNMFAVPKVI